MKRTAPSPIQPEVRVRFIWAGGMSLLAWALLGMMAPGASIPWTETMGAAAKDMSSSLAAVARFCEETSIPMELGLDPNRTCLVGPEHTELFTSLGQLEAKRTTTAPDFAGLLAHLLSEADVGEGDRVAVGASGSFPALLVATLAAVKAMGAEPVTILSLGASSFGATRPGFHLLDIYGVLEDQGLVSGPPAAVSLGGAGDTGGEFDATFRRDLLQEVQESGVPVLQSADLPGNVVERMALYGVPAHQRDPGRLAGVAAFVNIGGAEANLGISPKVLNVPPGLVRTGSGGSIDLPPEDQRGVLFEMLSRGVPVIHLLHVRGLVLRYGLPWDPLPLPEAGSTRLKDAQKGKNLPFWLLTAAYLGGLVLVVFRGRAHGWKSVR